MYKIIAYPENDTALINDLITEVEASGKQSNYDNLRKYIDKLSELGLNKMNTDFKSESFKKIDKNLYELRPNNLRIFFTVKDEVYYLLNGFIKETRKTPKKEIKKAKYYLKFIHENLE